MRTQFTPTFEIKIAFLGYVSAGKTTVINALLRDKYGEVSMRRTTAGVNYFRLSHRNQGKGKRKVDDQDSNNTATSTTQVPANNKDSDHQHEKESMEWTGEDEYRTAESTLREITLDNAAFRESSDGIHVKSFDIEIDEPLCDMRDDTKLVLVDIPGINEAGAGGKYRAYVTDKWDTFDCAIIVMDGRQGANTEEQVSLLEYVQKNNSEKKDIPVIILCNKIDDPDDEEQAVLVKEAREEVERIFKVPDRGVALQMILGNITGSKSKGKGAKKSRLSMSLFPAFIPISAVLAFTYRTATLMSLHQFRKLDKSLIEKLGRNEVGWKWRQMSEDEKIQLAHKAVVDQSLYQLRIEATNFDKVLKVLARAVGGIDTQLELIKKQINVAVRKLSLGRDIAAQVRSIFEKRQALGEPTEDLKAAFWTTYNSFEEAAFSSFSAHPLQVEILATPLTQLFDYYKFVASQEWKDEQKRALDCMKEFVNRQITIILDESCTPTLATQEALDSVGWGSLHPVDRINICQSLLLLSHERHFNETFGRLKIALEYVTSEWHGKLKFLSMAIAGSTVENCPGCPNSTLDFNRACHTCKTFFTPALGENLKEVLERGRKCMRCGKEKHSNGYRDWSHCRCMYGASFKCPRCNCGMEGESNYCNFCGRTVQPTKIYFSSIMSTALKNNSCAQILCPTCSKPLSYNRRCGACGVFYHFKCTKVECIFCSGNVNADGRCDDSTYKYCPGKKSAVWKELPCNSLEELLSLKYDSHKGIFKPMYPQWHCQIVQYEVPEVLSDPKHFGHVVWLYCELMASIKEGSK